MPLFNISDLIWDDTIYPRSARKQQTIDAYSEALTAGAQFPPIIIQPVINYPAPNTPLSEILMLILDGIHRWSACKVLGLTEIEAVLWLNPSDNQGARFFLDEVKAGITWEDSQNRN